MLQGLNLVNILVVIVVSYVLWLIYNEYFRWKLPPGPWGLPIIGHLPLLGTHPHVTFLQMRKRYGDIFRIRLGSFQTVVINGVKVKEAATRSDFDGRPAFYSVINSRTTMGFAPYNEAWKLLKKLVVSTMHDFVNARNSDLQEMMSDEVVDLVDDFSSMSGKPFNPKLSIYKTTCSITYKLCYGSERNLREDKEFLQQLTDFQLVVDFLGAGNPVEVLPWLKYVAPWTVKTIDMFIEQSERNELKKIREHEDTLEPGYIRDITDRLLTVDYSRHDYSKAGLSKEKAVMAIGVLVAASFDAVGTVMLWFLVYMIKYPEIQSRIYKEIEELTSGNRQVMMSDTKSLPFIEATILEVQRIRTPIPTLLPHATIRDTSIGGFDIPKDTVVLLNAYSLAMDESVWGDPENFRPERFLDDEGNIDTSMSIKITPFGLGMRKCPGDVLARLELFVILANLIQNFQLLPVEGAVYDMTPVHGLTDYPKPFQIITKTRNS